MKRILITTIAATLAFFMPIAWACAADMSPLASWTWRSDTDARATREVRIDLVRGSARIIRRPGPVVVEVRKTSETGKEELVLLRAIETGNVITIRDFYPSMSIFSMKECLPVTDRGDFFSSDVILRTIVKAPEGLPVVIKYRDEREVGGAEKN